MQAGDCDVDHLGKGRSCTIQDRCKFVFEDGVGRDFDFEAAKEGRVSVVFFGSRVRSEIGCLGYRKRGEKSANGVYGVVRDSACVE